MSERRRRQLEWKDLSARQRVTAGAGVALQVALAVTAWTDLAFRPAEQVRGRKPVWAAVIAINVVGPLLYFWRGISHHARAIP